MGAVKTEQWPPYEGCAREFLASCEETNFR